MITHNNNSPFSLSQTSLFVIIRATKTHKSSKEERGLLPYYYHCITLGSLPFRIGKHVLDNPPFHVIKRLIPAFHHGFGRRGKLRHLMLGKPEGTKLRGKSAPKILVPTPITVPVLIIVEIPNLA